MLPFDKAWSGHEAIQRHCFRAFTCINTNSNSNFKNTGLDWASSVKHEDPALNCAQKCAWQVFLVMAIKSAALAH